MYRNASRRRAIVAIQEHQVFQDPRDCKDLQVARVLSVPRAVREILVPRDPWAPKAIVAILDYLVGTEFPAKVAN